MKDALLTEIEDMEAACQPTAPEIRTPAKTSSELKTPKRTGRPADPNSSLPRIFDSIAQCSSVCGIPVPALRAAKKAGCPAFKHSRVDLVEFLKWQFGLAEDAISDWGSKLAEFKAQREEIKLHVDQQRVIDRSAVTAGIAKGLGILFSELDKSIQALPPALKGLTEAEIQHRLTSDVNAYKNSIRAALTEITKQPLSVDTK